MKGPVHILRVFNSKADAVMVAKYWRSPRGYTSRVFQRDVRVDGLRLAVWVVVIREAVKKGSDEND